MLRKFFLSMVIVIGLLVLAGMALESTLALEVHSHGMLLEPFEVLAGLTVVAAVMVVIGIIVTISVIGAVLFALFITVLALGIGGLMMGWPLVLAVVIGWLVFRDRKTETA